MTVSIVIPLYPCESVLIFLILGVYDCPVAIQTCTLLLFENYIR